MALNLHFHHADTVALADRDGFADGRLDLDGAALARKLEQEDERLARVRVHLTSPGDPVRIVCVKDVVQPRRKIAGEDPGQGDTCVLENVAVATCGPIVGFQEGIIDMSGPGAAYTPFSERHLIVLEIDARPGLDAHAHEAAVREAGLRAADHVAALCVDTPPARSEAIAWDEAACAPDLPRVAYVYVVLSQGLLHDTYVLGRNARDGLPMVVDPRIVFDNGIVSGNCVSACDKNTTFHHQNNPVITELLGGHGTRWNFVGTIITNEPTRLADKRAAADTTIDMVTAANADGAIISKEGFGNPDADLMMIIQGLEQADVKTVAITDEFAGTDGGSQSLADTTPEADALVSTGNANAPIGLPAMETVIGPLPDAARLAGGYPHSLLDDGRMEVELQAIVGATNQLGFGRLTCRGV